MGCTEPVAIAYAAALAARELGVLPTKVTAVLSGNIVKNVKSVVVPNTGGMRGIEAALAVGIIAGKPERKLEVIAEVTASQRVAAASFLQGASIEIKPAESDLVLDIAVTVEAGAHSATARIANSHTNLVHLDNDGVPSVDIDPGSDDVENDVARTLLAVAHIIDFADTLVVADVAPLIDRQIAYNSAIAAEGMRGDWGANIGRTLKIHYGNDVKNRAKYMAAAGSDARMSGCELPVVILSGSGNQGITASLPVIEYAKEYGVDREKLIRSLVVADLVAIHLKTGLGRLSAYCGAVCAGAAAGAGIAYLTGGRLQAISHTIVNALAITSGIICDGAKPSCAAKIAAAVDAGILGYCMCKENKQFYGGDGILAKGVEETIRNVGRLGKKGMRDTDKEIIRIMLEN
jgi:L-cysteine desulfidase